MKRNFIFGTAGEDGLRGPSGPNAPVSHDVIFGFASGDNLTGMDGNDVLFGGPGNDFLFGDFTPHIYDSYRDGRGEAAFRALSDYGPGNDRLFGGPGEDRLYGEDGNDVLHGGNGPDELRGGGGNDKLIGGRGEDMFIVAVTEDESDGRDTILDFQPGEDSLLLWLIDGHRVEYDMFDFLDTNGDQVVDGDDDFTRVVHWRKGSVIKIDLSQAFNEFAGTDVYARGEAQVIVHHVSQLTADDFGIA